MMTAVSALAPASIVIVLPTVRPDVLPTLMFVAPAADETARGVGPPLTITAPLFSSTVFATETLPTSQPARVYETHGAGVVFGVPESPFTMFGRLSTPPATGAVQYLNANVNVGVTSGR